MIYIKATPHNSRLLAQAAYHAKIFRAIFQKCSPIHQGLAALFGSYHKKISGALHHLELCGITLSMQVGKVFVKTKNEKFWKFWIKWIKC